jgi:tetratricopeptide (TPR) repeat protein
MAHDPTTITRKMTKQAKTVAAASWVTLLVLGAIVQAQQPTSDWQQDVRKYAEAQDWTAAMCIVDREILRAPRDMDVRAWRARVLAWSGQLAEAEHEYREILTAAPRDPDNWLGLASLYSRQGQTNQALQALNRAVDLDPNRADLRVARGHAFLALQRQNDAKLEFKRAITLDPANTEAGAGLLSLRAEPKHEVRVGTNTDLFNFADPNHNEGVNLISWWTPHWATSVGGNFYQLAGTDASKIVASLTGKLPTWGALTVGGATGRDNGIIPKAEAFFDYDNGWRLRQNHVLRGLEIVYGQHWYWYSTARILTINGTTLLYLPREWSWSLGWTAARSDFSGTGAEWRPSGMTRLEFPINAWNEHRLRGNLSFAAGTENFAQVDQIGRFSSQTFGGGVRFQLTTHQDLTANAGYQKRSQGRTQIGVGFTYGIRF